LPQSGGGDLEKTLMKRGGFDHEHPHKTSGHKSSRDFSPTSQQQIITLTVGSPTIT